MLLDGPSSFENQINRDLDIYTYLYRQNQLRKSDWPNPLSYLRFEHSNCIAICCILWILVHMILHHILSLIEQLLLFPSLSVAAFTASCNFIPYLFPFFSPCKRSIACDTYFTWQIFFFHSSHFICVLVVPASMIDVQGTSRSCFNVEYILHLSAICYLTDSQVYVSFTLCPAIGKFRILFLVYTWFHFFLHV